ncbi:MAG: IreB family regulatory phosphoprotein [Clostridia bacterium]|nr:IreB family regulatory phosphoprotein [Clostridia bacterium]
MIIENNKERIIIKVKSKPVISVSDGEIDSKQLLFDICEAIREGGYDPVSQIVGYIISEDPTHITNYKNARTLIGKLDRDELLKQIVESYIDKVSDEIEARKLQK